MTLQAIILDQSLVRHELKRIGREDVASARFLDHSNPVTIKLKGLSDDLLTLIRNKVQNFNISIFSPDLATTTGEMSTVLLSGTETSYGRLAEFISKAGDDGKTFALLLNETLKHGRFDYCKFLKLGNYHFNIGEKTIVMGILNVTPDSFSDGGKYNFLGQALEQAFKMVEDGADIIDIGGESTRPGYEKEKRVSSEEEVNRVIPVIKALKAERSFKTPISIDTYKAETAEAALSEGVEMLNDVWALKEDNRIAAVAARYGVPVCLMHNRRSTEYTDLISDIIGELNGSVGLAHEAGIPDEHIILDPGIGFGKTHDQNLTVMHHLSELRLLGYPLLLGTSRKRIVGNTLNLPVDDRTEGTAATIAYGITAGADIVRVHDVKEMKRVAVMTDAIVRR